MGYGRHIKAYKGGSLEDVIFNGTDTRKPNDYAFVELIFSNKKIKLVVNLQNMMKFRLKERHQEMEIQNIF